MNYTVTATLPNGAAAGTYNRTREDADRLYGEYLRDYPGAEVRLMNDDVVLASAGPGALAAQPPERAADPTPEALAWLSAAHQDAADHFAAEMPGVDRDTSRYWLRLLFDHYALALDSFRAKGVEAERERCKSHYLGT